MFDDTDTFTELMDRVKEGDREAETELRENIHPILLRMVWYVIRSGDPEALLATAVNRDLPRLQRDPRWRYLEGREFLVDRLTWRIGEGVVLQLRSKQRAAQVLKETLRN